MKELILTDEVPKWFIGKIKFTHEGTPFWEVKIKKATEGPISLYVFLFKIMKDLFKDKPELKMWKFWEIFEASMTVNGKEVTEKQIMEMFWKMFKIKFTKKWITK